MQLNLLQFNFIIKTNCPKQLDDISPEKKILVMFKICKYSTRVQTLLVSLLFNQCFIFRTVFKCEKIT